MKGHTHAVRAAAFSLALAASAASAADNYTFQIALMNSTAVTVAAVCVGLGARPMEPGAVWRFAFTGEDGSRVSCYAYDHHGNQVGNAVAVMDHHHMNHQMAFTPLHH